MEEGQHAKRWEGWTEQLPADVQATWDLMNDPGMQQQGRRILAGALGYILTQLDLIPDHQKAGSVDDTFVMRVAAGLASEYAGDAKVEAVTKLARLANEEEQVKEFLGDALFAKFRRYVMELADKTVRGRTTDHVLSDDRTRADMRRELDQAVKRMTAVPIGDAAQMAALEVTVRSYFQMKLGG